jgi:hypothetical protein
MVTDGGFSRMMALTLCAEKLDLLVAYQCLTHAHLITIGKMAASRIPAAEYKRLRSLAEKDRKQANKALSQLDQHTAGHGC